jgi:hypothetical protein
MRIAWCSWLSWDRARSKRLLVLVGLKKALALAVRNDPSRKRYSRLLSSLNGPGK